MSTYEPIYELTRGNIVESIHYGAVAIVDSRGNLLSSWGDPYLNTYLRSSAKPFQALPFIENRGETRFALTPSEVALICASHSGTAEHVRAVEALQKKIGVKESDLLCGAHYPYYEPSADEMKKRGEAPHPYCHNCSGKHTGMLAHAKMRDLPLADYINPQHGIQQTILKTFAEMCDLQIKEIELGIDGCSAPNFAVPLYNASLAFARLCDPKDLPAARAEACAHITSAMMAYPNMVGGPDNFDTHLMNVTKNKVVIKGGAEGYQAFGVLPGVSPIYPQGFGVAFKISDGDAKERARPGVSLEILRLLGVLEETELEQLKEFGPKKVLTNWENRPVGEARPLFKL
jgi:L-asparaginase II